MKKITKTLLAIGGVATGIAAITKLFSSKKEEEKELRCFRKAKVSPVMHRRCTTPPEKEKIPCVIIGTVGKGTSKAFSEEVSERQKVLEENKKAINSLSPDDRSIMKGLIDFLCKSDLVDELDESVTMASLIEYMKENGIFEDIRHICKKKDIPYDDTERIIHAVFKAGKFGKTMDAAQKLSVILDDFSGAFFDEQEEEEDDFDGNDEGEDMKST